MPSRSSSPRTLDRPSTVTHSRRRASLPVCALAVTLLAGAAPARAQQPIRRFPPPPARTAPRATTLPLPNLVPAALDTAGSWTELMRKVRIGRRVGVWLTDATVLKGDLLAIDERSITVRQKGQPRVLPAAEVTRVRYLTHASRRAFLATLVGVDGLCAALESRSAHPEPAECLDVGTVFFGLPAGGIASLVARGGDLYHAGPVSLSR